ncbi:MAG: cytochrome C biogenesis protein [endosymbiont of Escarpia spicata]|uniref:Cytochrome C biogenesis protein n=1 Tax=endosymbiont of Escarpia spicata TaxID=2200908 RepID=A0A370DL72_9GAMM|nr:MAG: cytochrome C biogenesis protein [endosymbiont of Escarpia spicata]
MLFELLAIAAYLGAGLCFALRLFRGETGKPLPRPLGLLLGFIGTALHGTLLYQGIATDTGINLGVFSATSLIAWTIVLLLLISSLSKPVENLGILLLPLAALSILLESRFSSVRLLSETASQGLTLHVLVSILAYSLFTLASVQALLLAIQDHHLHHRHPGGFVRALPPLQTMESLLFEMISVGFVLLTLALISGFVFLEDMFAQHLAHKSILSIVAWIVFGTLIWGRFRFGWRGQKAIIWTLSGFVVLMLAYFGSKVVIELILTA